MPSPLKQLKDIPVKYKRHTKPSVSSTSKKDKNFRKDLPSNALSRTP